MTARCLDLTQEAATDPARVGAKAAGLATAHRAGLPVLGGVVVPVHESRPVVEAIASAEGHSGRARLVAMQVQPDEALVAELRDRLADVGAPLIVRSSSPLEADGTWSGAFSTFHGISHDELATAVRGCWGSAFSVGVIDRAEQTGTATDELGLAVLVQPELMPDLGGTARLHRDGTVRITATDGPLRPLMAGHVEGQLARVAPDGTVTTTSIDDHDLLRRVADLSRRVGDLLDHHLIEWAAVGGEVTLLQSIRSHRGVDPDTASAASDPALASSTALRIAGLTQRYAGRLAEDLVLPWAVAAAAVPVLPEPTDADPATALAQARSGASSLAAVLWGGSPRAAMAEAERVLRQLRGTDAAGALERLEALPTPPQDMVDVVLASLRTVRDALLARGLVDSDAAFWRAGGDAVARALHDAEPIRESRLGVDRWEPYIHGVVAACGQQVTGTPGAPGAGAGRVHVFDETTSSRSPEGRYVIVASEPSPALGPMLWNAAGLVTRAGSTAAHLIEFAHSIGVPTVVGCELPELVDDDPPLMAVDGGRGVVSLIWPRGH